MGTAAYMSPEFTSRSKGSLSMMVTGRRHRHRQRHGLAHEDLHRLG